ncbi:MAG: hypothetical protein K2M07_08405 [Muribaculaceae bacterium]|nr:hypothetical protein [Muribaculaceae bacterium]
MTSFSSLHTKIEVLGLMVAQDSISPTSLASLLDEIITLMKTLDVKDELIYTINKKFSNLRLLITNNAEEITSLRSDLQIQKDSLLTAIDTAINSLSNKIDYIRDVQLENLSIKVCSEEEYLELVTSNNLSESTLYFVLEDDN